jgi:hypothetical protein
MAYFRVILHADGIVIHSHDKPSLKLNAATSATPITGFYTTRIVQARDETSAVEKAIEATNEELRSRGFDKVNLGQAPRFDAEEVTALNLWQFMRAKPRRGLTFYSEPEGG